MSTPGTTAAASGGNGQAFHLRGARLADLDDIMRIEESVFVTDAWSRSTMRRELQNANGHYLVAVPDAAVPEIAVSEPVLGYGGLFAPPRVTDADIQTLAVLPGARRSGIGRTLMLAMLAEAHRRGAGAVFLEVRADNPGAQALYAGLGFEPIGIRRHYYQPDDVDAVVMRRSDPEGAS